MINYLRLHEYMKSLDPPPTPSEKDPPGGELERWPGATVMVWRGKPPTSGNQSETNNGD